MGKVLLITLAFSFLPTALRAQTPEFQESGGIRWLRGGVGADERRELSRLRQGAILELLFVTAGRGGYLAEVQVRVSRQENNRTGKGTAPLAMTADGPVCLLAAPAGRYHIEATYRGHRRQRDVDVAAGMPRAARIVFTFPGEPWDGIWASDDEKRQAGTP